jgi:hypothetical protein
MVLSGKDLVGQSPGLDLYLPDFFEYFSAIHKSVCDLVN